MKLTMKLLLAFVLGAMPFILSDAQAEFRLGVGANYWKAVDDVDDDDFDEDGLSWILTSQFGLTDLAKLELAVERYDDGFAGADEEVYAPQAFLLLGSTIYIGAGIGWYYYDDEFSDDPFYALRAGLDLELLPSIYLDINANYRFADWEELDGDDINGDTVTLGAAVRLEF